MFGFERLGFGSDAEKPQEKGVSDRPVISDEEMAQAERVAVEEEVEVQENTSQTKEEVLAELRRAHEESGGDRKPIAVEHDQAEPSHPGVTIHFSDGSKEYFDVRARRAWEEIHLPSEERIDSLRNITDLE